MEDLFTDPKIRRKYWGKPINPLELKINIIDDILEDIQDWQIRAQMDCFFIGDNALIHLSQKLT